MSVVVRLLRFAGRLLIGLSFDLDAAWRDMTVETACPDCVPDAIDDGSAT